MIDIHNHLLWGLDDGPESWTETVAMLDSFSVNGVTQLCSTPHLFHPNFPSCNFEKIKKRYDEVVRQSGVRILSGAEHYFGSEFVDGLADISNKLFRLNNTKYVLMELSNYLSIRLLETLMARLRAKILSIIIAHPERYGFLSDPLKSLKEMKAMGCLFQVNAKSIVGKHGKICRKVAQELLECNLATVVASDAHYETDIQIFAESCRLVQKEYGQDVADLLFVVNPYCIINNRECLSIDETSLIKQISASVKG